MNLKSPDYHICYLYGHQPFWRFCDFVLHIIGLVVGAEQGCHNDSLQVT